MSRPRAHHDHHAASPHQVALPIRDPDGPAAHRAGSRDRPAGAVRPAPPHAAALPRRVPSGPGGRGHLRPALEPDAHRRLRDGAADPLPGLGGPGPGLAAPRLDSRPPLLGRGARSRRARGHPGGARGAAAPGARSTRRAPQTQAVQAVLRGGPRRGGRAPRGSGAQGGGRSERAEARRGRAPHAAARLHPAPRRRGRRAADPVGVRRRRLPLRLGRRQALPLPLHRRRVGSRRVGRARRRAPPRHDPPPDPREAQQAGHHPRPAQQGRARHLQAHLLLPDLRGVPPRPRDRQAALRHRRAPGADPGAPRRPDPAAADPEPAARHGRRHLRRPPSVRPRPARPRRLPGPVHRRPVRDPGPQDRRAPRRAGAPRAHPGDAGPHARPHGRRDPAGPRRLPGPLGRSATTCP